MIPVVLFHTHGIDRFDFSEVTEADLIALDHVARSRNVLICPTVYLAETRLHHFDAVLQAFARLKAEGQLANIVGWAIEGPVLGPKGGTPTGSTWRPTSAQWRRMAGWCRLGVKYMVIAPDILALSDRIDGDLTFAGLITLIYAQGGRVAIGHFEGACDQTSARRLEEVLSHIEAQFVRSPYLVLTDHLFNDMPRAFKHAFRTHAELASRATEIAIHTRDAWRSDALEELIGHTPAALLKAAGAGRLTPALNFDGGHVDLDICRMVVDYLGADRIIAITDHTETLSLAGEPLARDSLTRLLYRKDGVLAASSVGHEDQRENMRTIGISDDEISLMQYETPLAALTYQPCAK